MNLLSALAFAPLSGVTKRDPDTIHALPFQDLLSQWPGVFTAPCGRKNVRMLGMRTRDEVLMAVWPPHKAGPQTRCDECWVLTGKKRPRKVKP